MSKESINITPGHIARHTPRFAGAQGKEAAIIDIAQDLLQCVLNISFSKTLMTTS